MSVRSQNVQELMEKIPNWMIRWGNLIFLLITLSIFLLSWIIEYPEVIQCEVTIKSNPSVYKEYSKDSGIIDSVYIKDGSLVTKKSLILILKNEYQLSKKDVSYLKNGKNDTIISGLEIGEIYYTKNWFRGEKIKPNTHLFNIVPKKINNLVAELKVPFQSALKIKKGQKVKIKIENYPYKENGVIIGMINKIPKIYNTNGFYIIDIKLPKKLITTSNNEIEFRQEMLGSAEIITEDLRLIERFFSNF